MSETPSEKPAQTPAEARANEARANGVLGPRVVIPNTTFRDALIAAVGGLLILAFIVYGMLNFINQSKSAQSNTLTGTIVEKVFTSAPEELITVGSKGLKTKMIDGEYLFKVRVGSEARIFQVPVEKSTYQMKVVGDSQTFLRPRSER